MNKELELEAQRYVREKYQHGTYLGKLFIAGATSKYVEKQKLEFAIEYLYLVRNSCFDIDNRIKELEQKLSEL